MKEGKWTNIAADRGGLREVVQIHNAAVSTNELFDFIIVKEKPPAREGRWLVLLYFSEVSVLQRPQDFALLSRVNNDCCQEVALNGICTNKTFIDELLD